MHISRRNRIQENSAIKLCWVGENSHEVEGVYGITPFDDLLAKEDRDLLDVSEQEEKAIQIEAVRRLLIYLFQDVPNALEALKKLYTLCYCIAPELLGKFGTLDKISRQFSQTKQAFSKKLIGMNKTLNLRGRNQKSDGAVETYREITTANHEDRIKQERDLAHKEYMREWRKKNAEAIREYQREYHKKYKDKLAKKRRDRDNKNNKKGK